MHRGTAAPTGLKSAKSSLPVDGSKLHDPFRSQKIAEEILQGPRHVRRH